MNKRNTIKLTSIALVASMAVGLSASAVAGGKGNGPKDGNGPQSSLAVQNICKINPVTEMLDVTITLTDKSSGVASADVMTATLQGLQKEKRPTWYPLGEAGELVGIEAGDKVTTSIPICNQISNPLNADSKALNAITVVTLEGNSSKEEYLSRCKDDPATDDGDPTTDWDNEAILKIANYPMLCK